MTFWKRLTAATAAAAVLLGVFQAPALAAPTYWAISVDVNTHYLWPTQTATVTATANQSVTGTGLVISIFDDSTDKYIKTCTTGTTCTAKVTKDNPVRAAFLATVSLPPNGNAYPPPGEKAWGFVDNVFWYRAPTTLSASPTNLATGAPTTLTAVTGVDVGPTQFSLQIYDVTAGTRLKSCGSGTTCSVSTSQSTATTHKFVGYVGQSSTTAPPPLNQSTSPASFATWGTNWTISLTAPEVTDGPATITATADKNVGPTPYYITIFNLSNGTRIKACGTGTTCSVSYNVPGYDRNWFVAFVSTDTASLPPGSVQANSNTASTYNEPPG